MTVRAVLLRWLLSLVFVLNGVGGAIAATRMHVDPAHAAERAGALGKATAGQAIAGTACDDHQGSPRGDANPHGKTPAPDCCQSGVCACACAHMSQVLLPVPQSPGLVPGRDLAIARTLLDHAAPALPHLIRPPIR